MYIHVAHTTLVCLALLLFAHSNWAQADVVSDRNIAEYHLKHQPPETNVVLSLPEALLKTLQSNPDLLAFNHQIGAQQGRELQASLAPNPELNLEFENFLGTGQLDGVSNLETTISIGWILERGVRKRRIGVASAGTSLMAVEGEILRLDAVAETTRRFLQCLFNQVIIKNNKQAVALAEQTIEAVSKRVQTGRAPNAELARARAELAKIQLQLEDTEHELVSSYHQLATQWGVSEPQFASIQGDLFSLPKIDSYAELKSRIQNSPDIAKYLSKRRLGEAELRLAQAQRKPSWRINAGVRRFEAFNDQALIAGLTIPLAISNRNQGRIMEVQAKLEQNNADEDAERLQIETSLFVLYQEIQHSLHRVNRLQNDVIPWLEKALEDTQEAYELGRYSYFEWRLIQQDLLQAQQEVVEASTNAHASLIEIERLTGMQIAQPTTVHQEQQENQS